MRPSTMGGKSTFCPARKESRMKKIEIVYFVLMIHSKKNDIHNDVLQNITWKNELIGIEFGDIFYVFPYICLDMIVSLQSKISFMKNNLIFTHLELEKISNESFGDGDVGVFK